LLAIERVLTTADQSIAPSNEDIDVRLRYQGKDLVLSFPPTHGDAMYMASKFCHQKVSDQDLDVIRECTRKIGDYLIQEVEKHQQKQFMRQRVKTPFEESIAQNELEAESDVPTHTGFSTDEHKRVASRVSSSHLSDHYQLSDNGKLRVTLDIAGNRYIADYDMSRDSPIVAARRFCNVHKQELGITMQSLDTCVLPVEKHLRSIEREARLKSQSTISESNQEHHGVEDSTVEFDAFGRSHDRLNSRSNLDKFKSNKFQNLDEAMGASPKKSLKEDLNIQAALTKVGDFCIFYAEVVNFYLLKGDLVCWR
jgi:hypothetical protein